jgi:hypothetical protein
MPKKSKEDELTSDENWDWDAVSMVKPGRRSGRRTVVSVAFNLDDFELVAAAAERSDRKLSEFIRCSAIDKASSAAVMASVTGASASSSGDAEGYTKVSTLITYEQVSPKDALTA